MMSVAAVLLLAVLITPFGHHNNMAVMGLGSYRFADCLRAGWPVTLAAAAAGLAAISAFWI